MNQHFFAHGQYLGSRSIPPFYQGPEGIETEKSLAYFCRLCGETWARLKLEPPGEWYVRYQICRACGDGRLACAPHWRGDRAQFADDWPKAAVRWEFETSLARAEKELGK